MSESKILADAIKTIGRTLPAGMEVFFFRDEGSEGAGMTMTMPDGKSTEYRFLHSNPLPSFAVSILERDMQIELALVDLLICIDLNAANGSSQIDREALDPFIQKARSLLGLDWLSDEPHPVKRVDRQPAMDKFDLVAHLKRQREFSERTFGPGARTSGVLDHIRKELCEIEAAPNDLTEWVDVVLLALDGAWRAGFAPEQIAEAIAAKQARNESRKWPDWRSAAPGKAIEHVRDSGDRQPATISYPTGSLGEAVEVGS